jgi:hypothetical protein
MLLFFNNSAAKKFFLWAPEDFQLELSFLNPSKFYLKTTSMSSCKLITEAPNSTTRTLSQYLLRIYIAVVKKAIIVEIWHSIPRVPFLAF